MSLTTTSLRPFIGAKNFEQSRAFYRDLGFEEAVLEPNLSVFRNGTSSFYLQDYYVADWVNNTMLLLEVANVAQQYQALQVSNLFARYPDARLMPIKQEDWAAVFHIIDPSGVLWHVAEFRG
jgi:catechol 2,3-dioxygenase-like lactoylglutathione lyase family enzyme